MIEHTAGACSGMIIVARWCAFHSAGGYVADNRLNYVAIGTGVALEYIDLLKDSLIGDF